MLLKRRRCLAGKVPRAIEGHATGAGAGGNQYNTILQARINARVLWKE